MGLNISKGNMYPFITHTWNAIKGKCPHDCSYCYVKRFGKQPEVRIDEKEFKTDLGQNNYIFVGSSCDMFARGISSEWIGRTLEYMNRFNNLYLIQTKNPERFQEFIDEGLIDNKKHRLCVTIESNRTYIFTKSAPPPRDRAASFSYYEGFDRMITIEPILEFDLDEMISYVELIRPFQVNIGADSGSNNLPEPSRAKIKVLMNDIRGLTKVFEKKNLSRLIQ